MSENSLLKKYVYNLPLSISVRIVRITTSAVKRGGFYKLCYLSLTSRHFKISCKGSHKYYMTENVGFSRCIYVLGIALADVITYIERHYYLF